MRIPYETLKQTFRSVLVGRGAPEDKAELSATIFADTSLDGVYSHGVNRFPMFVSYIDKGYIRLAAEPTLALSLGALEQWNGNLGIGNVNAHIAMTRAMELASQHGIGCVALSHTNHWMRGGTYGLLAAQNGYAGICWTNTMPNMPAWEATDCRIGNNPLVMAVPNGDEPVLVDAAMSQFAYGALERYRLAGKELPLPGGYDGEGKLTTDPGAIEQSHRLLPMGYWKGCAFSVGLDLMAALTSGGNTTREVGELSVDEYDLSQVFIAIDLHKTGDTSANRQIVEETLRFVRESERAHPDVAVRCPGDGMRSRREDNIKHGIPVDERVWKLVTSL